MKLSKTFQFILGVIGILLLAAFVAPFLAHFIPYRFDRILSRTVLVLFAGFIIFLIMRNRGIDVRYYGLAVEKYSWARLGTAFAIGCLTLLLMTWLETWVGVRSWQFTFHTVAWPLKILKYLASAFFIGIFEEFLFRGLLFRTLEGRGGDSAGVSRAATIQALILTNLIYSVLHFLRYKSGADLSNPTFLTSLEVYAGTLKPLMNLAKIWPGAIGLFLFGLVLSYAYLRTNRNLIYPIGLHAGAVFFLAMDRWFVQVNDETHKIIFGGTDLHASVVGWVFIGVMGLAVYNFTSKSMSRAKGGRE